MFFKRHLSKLKGFSLLELMSVVFIIGILAAISLPLLNKYLLRSKVSEAELNLRKIYDGEVAYYHEEHTTQTGGLLSKEFLASGPTPAQPPQKDKRVGNWDSGNWSTLKFGSDSPVQYVYTAITGGTAATASFTARAEGDIDGDSVFSTFERVGSVDSISGEVQGGGALYELDPLE